jgi:orotidine-5'-phosphate decarboxylase
LIVDTISNFIKTHFLPFLISFFSGFVFLYLYYRHAKKDENAIFPLDLFMVRTFRVGMLGNLATRLGISSIPLLIPLMVQIAYGESAVVSGWIVAPMAITSMFGKSAVIKILNVYGYRKTLMINTSIIGALICVMAIPGMVAFKKTVDYCKEKGLIVIGDIKRGDIGSTSEAYAVGHLGKVQVGSKSYYGFDEDFVTVNPYLGSDGVNPFVKICKEEKKGIFVLVKTSNPSSGEFQDQLVNGRPLYELVGEKVAAWGADCMGDSYSYVGAVVGATYPEQGKVLRKVMPKAFILVPGYGAQGGKGADLVHFFNEDGLGAIINSSRGIIAAYQQEKYAQFGEQNYADASRAAVLDMREDIAQALAAR